MEAPESPNFPHVITYDFADNSVRVKPVHCYKICGSSQLILATSAQISQSVTFIYKVP